MARFLFIDLHLDLCVHRNPDPNDEPVPFLFFSCRLFYSKSAMVYNPQKLINNLNFLYTFAVDHLVRRPQNSWGKIIGGFWQRAGVWGLDPSCPGLGLSHHARRTRAGRNGDVLSFRLCLCIMLCPRPWPKRRYILTSGSSFLPKQAWNFLFLVLESMLIGGLMWYARTWPGVDFDRFPRSLRSATDCFPNTLRALPPRDWRPGHHEKERKKERKTRGKVCGGGRRYVYVVLHR